MIAFPCMSNVSFNGIGPACPAKVLMVVTACTKNRLNASGLFWSKWGTCSGGIGIFVCVLDLRTSLTYIGIWLPMFSENYVAHLCLVYSEQFSNFLLAYDASYVSFSYPLRNIHCDFSAYRSPHIDCVGYCFHMVWIYTIANTTSMV